MPDVKMVPTVPERELAICRRVRHVRESLKWSQPDFAKALAISRVRLASYEYGRAPIRFDLAEKLCEQFQISQAWLADDDGPMRPHIELPNKLLRDIPERERFSVIYDRTLKPFFEKTLVEAEAVVKGILVETGHELIEYRDIFRTPGEINELMRRISSRAIDKKLIALRDAPAVSFPLFHELMSLLAPARRKHKLK